jgi:hypothetical protein
VHDEADARGAHRQPVDVVADFETRHPAIKVDLARV